MSTQGLLRLGIVVLVGGIGTYLLARFAFEAEDALSQGIGIAVGATIGILWGVIARNRKSADSD